MGDFPVTHSFSHEMKHEKPRDDDATPRRIMTATEVAAYFKVHLTKIYKLLIRSRKFVDYSDALYQT